jgi:hypothetical protein
MTGSVNYGDRQDNCIKKRPDTQDLCSSDLDQPLSTAQCVEYVQQNMKAKAILIAKDNNSVTTNSASNIIHGILTRF